MAKAKFWVLTRTLWQGSEFSPVAGSFDTREEAEAEATKHADNAVNEYGNQDLRRVVRAIVVNTSTMKREYGYSVARANEAIYQYSETARFYA